MKRITPNVLRAFASALKLSTILTNRFLRIALLIVSLTAQISAQEARLPQGVHPTEQRVYLSTDPSRDRFHGTTEIDLKVTSKTHFIALHAKDITISKALLTTLEGPETAAELTVSEPEGGLTKLQNRLEIPPGSYRLKLVFEGPFNTRSVGLYKYKDGGRPYLSTQFEMTDARRCFPCFDEPSFKIPFQLTVEAPNDCRVYSNTPENRVYKKGEQTVHEFATTLPIPSYLVALAVGPYEDLPVENLSVPGRIVTPAGKLQLTDFARKNTPTYLQTLEEYFQIPYVYPKLDQVAVTEFPFGAMENAGMLTYREDILLINPATTNFDIETRAAMVVSHELAHQWFGNLVTMKWWDDLWLNEAFATWMAAKVVAKVHPEYEYHLQTPQNSVMGADANLTTKPIRKPIRNETDIMDGLSLAYNKGSAALNMVERWIGEENFRRGIQNYLNDYSFKNAEAADLWRALGQASDKDVESVLKSFTEQSGYPLLSVEVEGTTLRLKQRRYTLAGVQAPSSTWTVPLFIRYGRGKQSKTETVLLKTTESEWQLDFEPEWVFPDDSAVGYYRWQLTKPQLQSLLEHRAELNERERIALIFNIQGLFEAGEIDAGEMLGTLGLFLDDKHPSIVSMALSALHSMGRLYVREENQELWKNYLSKRLPQLVARYKLLPAKGEHPKVKALRPLLLEMMWHDLGDIAVLETARRESEKYLRGSAKVEPTLADTYLRIAAREGDESLVDRVKIALSEASDPQRRTNLLEALGSFGKVDAQRKALGLMLDPVVTSSDLRILLGTNAVEESRRLQLQLWLEENYQALSQKVPAAFLGQIVMSLQGARDNTNLQHVQEFFGNQPDPNGVLARELDKLTERVQTRIDKIKRGQASFEESLKN